MANIQVALIRGINVGRAKRVAMADLRAALEELGYENVRTLLNSGNVVFGVPSKLKGDAGPQIEKAMAKACGVSARVTVLTAAEIATAVRRNPLGDVAHDPARMLVCVLNNPADRARLKPLTQQDWAPDALAVGARVAYMWCADGLLESRLAIAVNRLLGDAATTRNWTTMTKLHALASDS